MSRIFKAPRSRPSSCSEFFNFLPSTDPLSAYCERMVYISLSTSHIVILILQGLREAIQGSINLSRNSTGAFIYCMSSKSLSPDRQIFTVGSTVLPNNFMVNTCIFTYLGPQSRCSIPWLTGDRTLNNGYVFARILIFGGEDKYKNERVQHPTLRQHPHPYYYPSTTRFINRTFLCT